MNGTNTPKEFQIHPWGKIDRGLGENTLRWGKPVGEAETPVLGELISPKNSKIPWRNQGITNGSLGDALMIVLERKRERSEKNGEGGKFY
jgi:hypothetical protein